METKEILPCPFCGSDINDYPECMIIEKRRINPDMYYIHCISCGAHGGGGWSKKEAIEKWNRRK
jgi:Lar family restriction alleviation protein